ncbi:Methyl-CpG-binding domain-containing protein 2 [Abeliophyllum distichum]|uniref:Methyl-CpG-binding domain-containing protein 2 n=1 Tax=Abeliophyllum distichum TaxID=126358 RepID=A0ABD1VWF4_9LAMI
MRSHGYTCLSFVSDFVPCDRSLLSPRPPPPPPTTKPFHELEFLKEMERKSNRSNAANGTEVVPCPSSSKKTSKRVWDSIAAYTVQCAICSKWRFIPSKEKYEEIRERITEEPFFCDTAREWRPEITCDDEPDLVKDGSWRWAIDKPSIPQPPPGWQRILRIRAEGGTKFADVYYVAPSGKRLRSMVEVESYLSEHLEYPGVTAPQFSFQIPAPLEENYVRKRHARSTTSHKMSGNVMPVAVNPISLIAPDQSRDSHFGGERNSTSDADTPAEGLELFVKGTDSGAMEKLKYLGLVQF